MTNGDLFLLIFVVGVWLSFNLVGFIGWLTDRRKLKLPTWVYWGSLLMCFLILAAAWDVFAKNGTGSGHSQYQDGYERPSCPARFGCD